LADFEFRPLAWDDLPLLHRWLNTPHVLRWWREPLSLDEVRAKYGVKISGEEPTQGYVIAHEGRPVGFIQSYRIADHPEYAEAIDVEDGAAGLDLYLGEPDCVHRGLGTAAVRQFLREVIFADPEVTCCVLGPDPENAAAIRCYEKVGFRYLKTVQVPDEPNPEYLMRIGREHALST
jgi:RimJ/RimL family protein N-acetyltransferase